MNHKSEPMKLTNPLKYSLLSILFILLMTYSCKNEVDLPAPTEEQLSEVKTAINDLVKQAFSPSKRDDAESRSIYEEKMQTVIDSASAKFSFDKLTLKQIHQHFISSYLLTEEVPAVFDKIFPRLLSLSKDSDLEGARAASYVISLYPSKLEDSIRVPNDKRDFSEKYNALINHPSLDSLLLSSGRIAGSVFSNFSKLDKIAVFDENMLDKVRDLFNKPLSVDASLGLKSFFEILNTSEFIDNGIAQEVRLESIEVFTRIRNQLDNPTDRENDAIEGTIKFLEGAYAKNELINNTAPNVNFIWSSTGKDITLSDYKGKVVILDFWATWCGPCIASFPNVNKLIEYYKGYPVEVLGLTSLQGYHVDPVGKQRIVTKDDPKKEFELMPSFMEALNMNWTVAFSENNVFDPNYGVDGIPHVALIDPNGVVKYNKLNPTGPPYEKAEMINAILKEFNLPYPKEEMTKENFVEFPK